MPPQEEEVPPKVYSTGGPGTWVSSSSIIDVSRSMKIQVPSGISAYHLWCWGFRRFLLTSTNPEINVIFNLKRYESTKQVWFLKILLFLPATYFLVPSQLVECCKESPFMFDDLILSATHPLCRVKIPDDSNKDNLWICAQSSLGLCCTGNRCQSPTSPVFFSRLF